MYHYFWKPLQILSIWSISLEYFIKHKPLLLFLKSIDWNYTNVYFSHFRALYEYTWRSERLNFRLHYDNDDHLRVSCLLKRDDKAREKRPNLKMHLCWLFSISSGISDGYQVLLPKNGLVYFKKINWTKFFLHFSVNIW